ncbi:MFS transporter [Falsiroseomonas ponticola]|uniref:MFS transporter n=1 Tax=Falsiroseomonas ponticola TaxID=2786951 RepID=UPI00193346CD|nr:MFS transporter [Roseomonas ponticola]
MFAASASGTTRAPFLLDMARDLGTSLTLTANVMALTSIAWGSASLAAGPLSDRFGRRPFLVLGPTGLALGTIGVAVSGSFAGVAACATLAGASAGTASGALMAEVSSRVPDRQRGRALGWVIAGQSMALLVGVPLAAWIGAHIGWRGVNWCVAAVTLLAVAGLVATTRRPAAAPAGGRKPATGYRAALSGPVLRLLAMGVAERSCYGLAVIFFATFLQATYRVPLAALAVPLAIFALGTILGTIAGGQLADRLPDRRVTFAGAMLAAAAIAVPLFLWTGGMAGSVALGFAFVFCAAVSRPSLMAALANVPEEVRGTVLGLNVTSASFGWLFAASLGGLVIATFGFAGFAPLAAGFGVLGAVLALAGGRSA